VSVEMIQLS